jgi:hypothetical protein
MTTTPTPPDPLLDALRTLPQAEPAPAEAARVHRLARAVVAEATAAPALPRPPLWRGLLVASAVVGYFAWAVIFVLATHLSLPG